MDCYITRTFTSHENPVHGKKIIRKKKNTVCVCPFVKPSVDISKYLYFNFIYHLKTCISKCLLSSLSFIVHLLIYLTYHAFEKLSEELCEICIVMSPLTNHGVLVSKIRFLVMCFCPRNLWWISCQFEANNLLKVIMCR